MKKKPARTRRTAHDARLAILDAAEKRLERVGPAGLRLQDVAADVGVSHPAVLHHFGSREQLVGAVIERAMEKLHGDLFGSIVALGESGREPDSAAMFEIVHDVMGRRGHARVLAWLFLSGYDPLETDAVRLGWRSMVQATHDLRVTRTKKGKKPPSREDTIFAVVASALLLFGAALGAGRTLRAAGSDGEEPTQRRFRAWCAKLFEEHMRPK